MTADDMFARLEGMYIAAAEQVLREIYAADRRGDPSPGQLAESRRAAISLFKLVLSKMGGPPTEAEIRACAKISDERLMAKTLEVLRPKIREVLIPMRLS